MSRYHAKRKIKRKDIKTTKPGPDRSEWIGARIRKKWRSLRSRRKKTNLPKRRM